MKGGRPLRSGCPTVARSDLVGLLVSHEQRGNNLLLLSDESQARMHLPHEARPCPGLDVCRAEGSGLKVRAFGISHQAL